MDYDQKYKERKIEWVKNDEIRRLKGLERELIDKIKKSTQMLILKETIDQLEKTKIELITAQNIQEEQKKAYEAEEIKIRKQIKSDIFEDLGITENPKAEKLWDIAYQHGRHSGYNAIYAYASDLVELIM